jgi:hypothetical protein
MMLLLLHALEKSRKGPPPKGVWKILKYISATIIIALAVLWGIAATSYFLENSG